MDPLQYDDPSDNFGKSRAVGNPIRAFVFKIKNNVFRII